MPLDLRAIKERLATIDARHAYAEARGSPPPGYRPDDESDQWAATGEVIEDAGADVRALVSEVESLRALLRDGLKRATEFEGFCPYCLGFGGSPEDVEHNPGCGYRASAIREEP